MDSLPLSCRLSAAEYTCQGAVWQCHCHWLSVDSNRTGSWMNQQLSHVTERVNWAHGLNHDIFSTKQSCITCLVKFIENISATTAMKFETVCLLFIRPMRCEPNHAICVPVAISSWKLFVTLIVSITVQFDLIGLMLDWRRYSQHMKYFWIKKPCQKKPWVCCRGVPLSNVHTVFCTLVQWCN